MGNFNTHEQELIKKNCQVRFIKRKLYLYLPTKDDKGDVVYWKSINYWKKDRINLEKEKEEFSSDVIMAFINNIAKVNYNDK